MSPLEKIVQSLSQLTQSEKALLLEWLMVEVGLPPRGIDSTADVLGGEARIVRTRIPVWVLVQARRLGTTNAELLQSYPTLRDEDLENAWVYARMHREEIDQQILQNESA